jgi:hypothetical protein
LAGTPSSSIEEESMSISRKMTALASLMAVLGCAAAVQAAPAPRGSTEAAREYFGSRGRAEAIDGSARDDIRAEPEKFDGRLLEVRGLVAGIAGSESARWVVVETQEGALTLSPPSGKDLSRWSFVDVGARIRALCRVVVAAGRKEGSLELVAAVEEAEAVRAEREQTRDAPPGAAQPALAPVRPMAREEILTAYAGSLRYFSPALSEQQAKTVAAVAIDESRKHAVDARLVVAVLAVEGFLKQHGVQRGQVMLRGRPVRSVAGSVALDLKRRMRAEKTGRFAPAAAVQRALVKRAQERLYRGDRGGRRSAAYASKVFDAFERLRGAHINEVVGDSG